MSIRCFLFLVILFVFSKVPCTSAQGTRKIDMIIEINRVLVNGEIKNIHLELTCDGSTKRIDAEYIPGHLLLDSQDFIRIDTTNVFTLCFDHAMNIRGYSKITNFKVKISHHLLNQAYMILYCFDFHNKKYRRLYKNALNQDFVVAIDFPNSGLQIPDKKGYSIYYFNEQR